jgi:hypothetical protein
MPEGDGDEHAPVVCISAFMPRVLKEEFAELAAEHDRSFSAELSAAREARGRLLDRARHRSIRASENRATEGSRTRAAALDAGKR